MEEYRKRITKEEILKNFSYYDIVALQKILGSNFAEIGSTRQDLQAAKEKVIKQGEEYGVKIYGAFVSHKRLKEEQEKVELIADIVTALLRLKEKEIMFKKGFTSKCVEIQYWGQDFLQQWRVKHEEENGEWFLERIEDIPQPSRNWGD
ncbi:MAG: hypothetical protein EOM19_02085 [Candidatus Moranbacteria bacterium]|nr:hypothetical protein [Candidatus Moranbacteria bacterium]